MYNRATIIDIKILLRFFVALGAAFAVLLIFFWMISSSMMGMEELYSATPRVLPQELSFENYFSLITESSFLRYLFNSILVCTIVVPTQIVLASIAGYVLAKRRFAGRMVIFYLFLLPMMIPSIVIILPTYFIVQRIGLTDTYWALSLPFLFNAWSVFFFRQFYVSFPDEIEDVACIDGSSNIGFYLKIVLPLSRTAVFALAVMSFAHLWREFIWPLLVNRTNEMRTLEVGIAFLSNVYHHNPGIQMAAAAIGLCIPIGVFIAAKKYLLVDSTSSLFTENIKEAAAQSSE